MWNKSEANKDEPNIGAVPAPSPSRSEPRKPGDRAIIGPSITVRGDITGEEDLLVQGRVEGKVELKKNLLVVGDSGHVKADIVALSITVEGEVEGTLSGVEQVVLRRTARVQGDIAAPRVTLEDGARFRGTIDMEVAPEPKTKPSPSPTPKTPPALTENKPGKDGKAAAGS